MNTQIVSLTVCLSSLAFADQVHRLPSGLQLQTPPTWQVQPNERAASLIPPGHNANDEAYIAGIMTDPIDINDSSRLPGLIAQYFPALAQIRISAPPTPFTASGGRGMAYAFDARTGFTPIRVAVYMVDLSGKAVALLAGIGRRDLVLGRNFELIGLASTFQASAPAQEAAARPSPASPVAAAPGSSSPAVRSWMQRLTDKKLVQLSSYNSGGGGGGMSSEKYLYLASDTSYAFRSSSSVAVYVPGANGSSGSRNSDGGTWRVIEAAGQPVLELNSTKGQTERIALSSKGSETYLNGRRWFVVGINE